MEKPDEIIINAESYLKSGSSALAVGIGILLLAITITFTQTDATIKDIILPIIAVGVIWSFWMAIHYVVESTHKVNTKKAIDSLYKHEIWQVWQYPAEQWKKHIEEEHQSMLPDKGLAAYQGAGCSSIVGAFFCAIMILVGTFIIKNNQIMPAITISAGAIFLIFMSVGLSEPIKARQKAKKYKEQAFRTSAPRVWFGEMGIYHECFGYTSLEKLQNINDHIKKMKSIKFTIEVSTVLGGNNNISVFTHNQQIVFLVPDASEERASQLVRRYRQQRLHI
ncbi:MAG: hypothetical protein JEZ00_09790 [Anaerolineaceae bacterium]|nr:hypothetical protein [Anaerolineaceae bacterium]